MVPTRLRLLSAETLEHDDDGRARKYEGLVCSCDQTATAIGDIDQTVAITHVAFLIDGDKFDEALKKAQRLGDLRWRARKSTGIAYSFFLSDPDGHQIEVTTYHPPLPPAPPPKRGP